VLQVSQAQVYLLGFEMVLRTLSDNHLHEGRDFHWVLERRLVYREVRTSILRRHFKFVYEHPPTPVCLCHSLHTTGK